MNEIQIKHKMIAMEALQVGLPVKLGSPTFLKVKGIAKAISQWAQEKVRPELRVMPVIYTQVKKDLEKSNFMDLAKVKITVPRGLKGYMNAYVEGVFEAFLVVENINKDVLIPFSQWLSIRLASPGSLANANANKDLKGYNEVDITKAESILAGFVDPNSRREAAEFDTVYPSISVMKTTWDNINAMTTRYLETNPSKVLKLVNDIAEKVDRLIKVVEAMPEAEAKLSAQTTVVLSGICAQMAQAVDLYGQIGVLVREMAVVGTRNVQEVQSYAKTSSKKAVNMAMESLDLGNDIMMAFDGHQVSLDQLMSLINRFGECNERLPIEHFEWVIEEGLTQALSEEDSDRYFNEEVFAVRFEGTFYPVYNINVIGVAAAAGHASVRTSYIDHSELVQKLTLLGV